MTNIQNLKFTAFTGVEALNSTLAIEPLRGKGTTMRVEIPFRSNDQREFK